MTASGALRFVRYAYPPNVLGYCGPPDSEAFRRDPVPLARSFTGAWPYLELIAARTGIGDPLDGRVVEAYWVGSALLDGVGVEELAGCLRAGFGTTMGEPVTGGVPHHSFHVLCVYPWAGLLPEPRMATQALTVLDRCRIRWGRVIRVRAAEITVVSRPLTWDGRRLALGPLAAETARTPVDTDDRPSPGEYVSLHWDWICERLTHGQIRALQRYTAGHLDLVNRRTQLSPVRTGMARPGRM